MKSMISTRSIKICHIFFVILILVSCSFYAESKVFGDMIKRGKKHQSIAARTAEDYQKCRSTLKNTKEAEAMLVVQGNRVLFTCPICLAPKENAGAVWRRLFSDEATFIPVDLDGVRMRVLVDLSLEIMEAWPKDSGIFICFLNTEIRAKYSLDVVEEESHRTIIMNGRRKGEKGLSKDVSLSELNLIVGMSWSEWSECNRCGKIGRRRRVGICMVRKANLGSPTKPEDCRYLDEYQKGIPCRSNVLSKKIRELSAVANTKSEFVIGFCKVPCPTEASIVVITDVNGKVVDTVDNSQGVYSMQQPLPRLPPLVKRKVVYEAVDSSVILSCPGNNEAKFLTWRNQSAVINPSKVHRLTKGRVKIDLGNNLLIRKLRFLDTATYSCWDDKKLIGTVRLQVVDKELKQTYRVFVLNTAIVFTFLLVLLISLTVCKNVKLQTKH